MAGIIDVILLCALPASGKSETRKYLETRTAEECASDFHLGHTVQLDDYPYVHFFRRVDEELIALNREGVFFLAPDKNFRNGYDWGTLLRLVNGDFADLHTKTLASPEQPAKWLFDRIDAARKALGQPPVFESLPAEVVATLIKGPLKEEASIIVEKKNKEIPDTLDGKTVVIEFARGAPHGSEFPVPEPFGYQYSLAQLSDDILQKAALLYVWVTPEQSRAKNLERARPDGQGSILFHGVPEFVMMNDYGTDDIDYLLSQSDRPNTIKVVFRSRLSSSPAGLCSSKSAAQVKSGISGKEFCVPVGRFDNRGDLTTFAREPVERWSVEDTEKIRKEMARAFGDLVGSYLELH